MGGWGVLGAAQCLCSPGTIGWLAELWELREIAVHEKAKLFELQGQEAALKPESVLWKICNQWSSAYPQCWSPAVADQLESEEDDVDVEPRSWKARPVVLQKMKSQQLRAPGVNSDWSCSDYRT